MNARPMTPPRRCNRPSVSRVAVGSRKAVRSPVVSVGDRVIDAVPAGVKDWAISAFGTADKAVLVGGILVVLGIAAAAVGVLTVRRGPAVGVAGAAVLSAVAVLASLGRGSAGWTSVLPGLAAGAAAGSVLVLLRAGAAETAVEHSPARRRFLITTGGLAAGAVAVAAAGRWLQQRGAAAAERLRVVLPRPARPLPPVPDAVEVGVRGVTPFLTPNEDFYRIDTALVVPQVDPRDWTLQVTGSVDRELELTYAELLDRPMVEADVTIACVSNEVGGDLVGTARWLGCRLDDLLDEAGVRPDADQVVGRSVDGFTAGFPTAVLAARDALVAVGMNGEPLPIAHGFPARLIVPGLYGYVSATKWLAEIELTRFDRVQGYWVPRGWAVEAPVKTQSRIDTPRPGRTLTAGEEVAVAGVAWAPIRGIERVEVQIDDEPWREATLAEQHAGTTWRQWVLRWRPEPGTHRIRVRATDADGDTQTDARRPPAPDGATGWHTISVDARRMDG